MRLLDLSYEEIEELTESYEKQIEEINYNNLTLSWYMRGGVTYDDVMNMGTKQLEMINKIVEKNLETTKKSQLPFF
jgi:hypothetical protein